LYRCKSTTSRRNRDLIRAQFGVEELVGLKHQTWHHIVINFHDQEGDLVAERTRGSTSLMILTDKSGIARVADRTLPLMATVERRWTLPLTATVQRGSSCGRAGIDASGHQLVASAMSLPPRVGLPSPPSRHRRSQPLVVPASRMPSIARSPCRVK
jgi:hypothetical protein